jgi:hypothetical protein
VRHVLVRGPQAPDRLDRLSLLRGLCGLSGSRRRGRVAGDADGAGDGLVAAERGERRGALPCGSTK